MDTIKKTKQESSTASK